jgi:ABC-type multidrug transport system ATPase subunit
VPAPAVLFLDEPTTGLDPRARNELWAVLGTLLDAGTTLLLTTQYLEEADRLAHEIVVIDHGSVIARGDAPTLKRDVNGDQLVVVPRDPGDPAVGRGDPRARHRRDGSGRRRHALGQRPYGSRASPRSAPSPPSSSAPASASTTSVCASRRSTTCS